MARGTRPFTTGQYLSHTLSSPNKETKSGKKRNLSHGKTQRGHSRRAVCYKHICAAQRKENKRGKENNLGHGKTQRGYSGRAVR